MRKRGHRLSRVADSDDLSRLELYEVSDANIALDGDLHSGEQVRGGATDTPIVPNRTRVPTMITAMRARLRTTPVAEVAWTALPDAAPTSNKPAIRSATHKVTAIDGSGDQRPIRRRRQPRRDAREASGDEGPEDAEPDGT